MKIYFAGSIRGGRDDWALYRHIIGVLSEYGTVLTEHIGIPSWKSQERISPIEKFTIATLAG